MRQMRWIFFIVMLAGKIAFSQEPFFKQIPINRDNINLGFNSMYIDSNRVLWMATTGGLYSYTGADYSVHTLKNAGLTPDLTSVAADRKGVIWTGFKSGDIAFNTDSGLVHFRPQGDYPKAAITSIYQASDHLWFATGGDGVYFLEDGKLHKISSIDGLADDYVYNIHESKGSLWIATDHGITVMKREKEKFSFTQIDVMHGLPDFIVRDFEADAHDNIWIALQDSGVCKFNLSTQTIEVPSWSRRWSHGPVNNLYLNGDELWIATAEEGLFYINMKEGDQLKNYKGYDDLKISDVKQILIDEEENLWLTTPSGIIQSHGNWLTFLKEMQKEKLGYIHSVYCNSKNEIFFTPDQGLVMLSGQGEQTRIRKFVITPFSDLIDIVSLYEDEGGYVWVGTMGAGLFRLNPQSGSVHKVKGILDDASILSIDGKGNDVWLATFGGAFHATIASCNTERPEIKIERLDEKTLGNFYIYTVFVDSRNRVWFGTDQKGLICFDEGRFKSFTTEQGLKSNTIFSITEDNKGAVWFSTADEGVCRYDGRTFKNYGASEGMRELTITSLRSLEDDRLIMVHRRGIDILHTSLGKIDYYGVENNLADINPDLNAITIDTNGRVWMGTEKGLVIYDPSLIKSPAGPQVIIQRVSLLGSTKNLLPESRFTYFQNSLAFDFTGIWFTDPSRLNYQYKLEGYSDTWISTRDRQIVFPNLPPGQYIFHIRASLSPSFTVSETASYSFTIDKPVWKENWFIVLCFVSFIVAAGLFIRGRDRRLKGIEALKKESIEYRFETLKSQVNPHFLFNSFNTLIAIIEKDRDVAIEYVEKLSDYFRNMIQHRDKETIVLRDEIEMVRTYYYLQKKRFGDYLQLDIKLDNEVMNKAGVPPLTLQLLIENAVKHNAVSKDTPLKVEIVQSGSKTITVRNNINVKMTKEVSTGIGLQNIINRYKILTPEKVVIIYDQNYFSITIPLI